MKNKILVLLLFFSFWIRLFVSVSPFITLIDSEKVLSKNFQENKKFYCQDQGECSLNLAIAVYRLPTFLGFGSEAVIYWGKAVSVFAGFFFAYFCYLIFKKIFPKREKLSFLFLLMMSVNPEFVFLSRHYSGYLLGLFFLSAFWYLCFKIKDFRKGVIPAFFLLVLSVFTSNYLFVLVLISILVLFFIKVHSPKKRLVLSFLFLSIIGFMVLNKFFNYMPLKGSFGFFNDIGFINAINYSRGVELNFGFSQTARFLYNKSAFIIFWLSYFLKQFRLSDIFSLFEEGGHSSFLQNGPLLLIFTPFFLLGVFRLFAKLPLKKFLLGIGCLLAAGVPSSFLSTSFNQDLFVPALLIICVYSLMGLDFILNDKKIYWCFFYFLLAVNFFLTFGKIITDLYI